MSKNKFTVFGVDLTFENENDYNTETEESIERDDLTFNPRGELFHYGLQPNKVAKSDDINVALKEVSLVTVAILEWVKEFLGKDKDGNDESFSTPKNGQEGVDTFIDLVHKALKGKMDKVIEPKEDCIPKGTGFLKYNTTTNVWSWDNNKYIRVEEFKDGVLKLTDE